MIKADSNTFVFEKDKPPSKSQAFVCLFSCSFFVVLVFPFRFPFFFPFHLFPSSFLFRESQETGLTLTNLIISLRRVNQFEGPRTEESSGDSGKAIREDWGLRPKFSVICALEFPQDSPVLGPHSNWFTHPKTALKLVEMRPQTVPMIVLVFFLGVLRAL